jgi:hypothetical protein
MGLSLLGKTGSVWSDTLKVSKAASSGICGPESRIGGGKPAVSYLNGILI